MHSKNAMIHGMPFWLLVLALGLPGSVRRDVEASPVQTQNGSPALAADRIDGMVAAVVSVFRTKVPIPPLMVTFGSFSIDEAYRVQDALNRELGRELGKVVGYKVAHASKAAQQQFGMAEPAYAALFQAQRISSGTTVKTGEILGLFIETEIAFTIGKRIDRPLRSVAELRPHVRWVHAAFDIGEDRFDPDMPPPLAADMVASGAAAHRFVLGPAFDPSDVDADAVLLKTTINGRAFTEGAATNVMGSPWNALLWIANRLVDRGKTLEPGDAVLTGTAGSAFRARGRDMTGTYLGDCGPLGQVTVSIK